MIYFQIIRLSIYGDAETKLGVFAAGVLRESIVISDKSRKYSGKEMRKAVLSSCDHLGTNTYIYFVHQVDERNADVVFSADGALNALHQLKKECVIRFVGIASHCCSVLERAARDPRVDILQISGNVLECGMHYRMKEDPVMQKKGIILNKVYAAGLLTQDFSPAELIGGILNYLISCTLIGIGTHDQAVAAMGQEYLPYNLHFEEVTRIPTRHHDLIVCDRCQRCVWKDRHEIHSVIRYFNYMKLGKEEWAREKLGLHVGIIRNHCRERTCESTYLQRLSIPDLIEQICAELEGNLEGCKSNL